MSTGQTQTHGMWIDWLAIINDYIWHIEDNSGDVMLADCPSPQGELIFINPTLCSP
jgi:hypothetical protein